MLLGQKFSLFFRRWSLAGEFGNVDRVKRPNHVIFFKFKQKISIGILQNANLISSFCLFLKYLVYRHCVFQNKTMLYLLKWYKFFLKIFSSTRINMRKRWVITRCIFCFAFESVLTDLKYFWCFTSQHF